MGDSGNLSWLHAEERCFGPTASCILTQRRPLLSKAPDFNILERRAHSDFLSNKFFEALAIYYHMADGDPSLDAGYLGMRIGECYESLGHLRAAKYWYSRAVEENPTILEYVEARRRLEAAVAEAP